MTREPNKRPRRNPLTAEEVSNIIAHKRKRELVILYKFKKSRTYKLLNCFIIACIFIYLELLFCYFGPCHYQKHYTSSTITHYGTGNEISNKLRISDIDLIDLNGKMYKFIIGDFMEVPGQKIEFLIGKDFLLQKELKGLLNDSLETYRLFSASPVLFLCIFTSFISFFGFIMNLNENAYTLIGLSILNFLAMLAIVTI